MFVSFVVRLWLLYWAVWLVGAVFALLIARVTRRGESSHRLEWIGTIAGYSVLVVTIYQVFCARVVTERVTAFPSLQSSSWGPGLEVWFEFSGHPGFYWAVESEEIREQVAGSVGGVSLIVERVVDFGCTRSLRIVRCGDLEQWTMDRSCFVTRGAARPYGKGSACWCP